MEKKMKADNIFHVVFTGVGLAMGVAALVLNALGAANASTEITLLAIGLFALAMSALDKE